MLPIGPISGEYLYINVRKTNRSNIVFSRTHTTIMRSENCTIRADAGVSCFSGQHRMGPVKQSWKRVRRFILRLPSTGKTKDVHAAGVTANMHNVDDIDDIDDIDDMGRDFVRNMDFDAAFADAVSKAVLVLSVASARAAKELSATASAVERHKKMANTDNRRLRRYMWKGYATDSKFSSLQLKWPNYTGAKRVRKMAKLQIPPSFMQCCPDTVACKCEAAAVEKYFAAVGCKKSLHSALSFLLKRASRD